MIFDRSLLLFLFLRLVSDLSLPEEVIRDAESAWRKVVALVNGSRDSDHLESQFLPLFDGNATGVHCIEG